MLNFTYQKDLLLFMYSHSINNLIYDITKLNNFNSERKGIQVYFHHH
jgi:hypothetical protein